VTVNPKNDRWPMLLNVVGGKEEMGDRRHRKVNPDQGLGGGKQWGGNRGPGEGVLATDQRQLGTGPKPVNVYPPLAP